MDCLLELLCCIKDSVELVYDSVFVVGAVYFANGVAVDVVVVVVVVLNLFQLRKLAQLNKLD